MQYHLCGARSGSPQLNIRMYTVLKCTGIYVSDSVPVHDHITSSLVTIRREAWPLIMHVSAMTVKVVLHPGLPVLDNSTWTLGSTHAACNSSV